MEQSDAEKRAQLDEFVARVTENAALISSTGNGIPLDTFKALAGHVLDRLQGYRDSFLGREHDIDYLARQFQSVRGVRGVSRKASQAARRTAGLRVSGNAPYGWTVGKGGKLVRHEDQQRAITRMRDLRRQGKSFRAIKACIVAEFGSAPSAFGVQRIVDNKRQVKE